MSTPLRRLNDREMLCKRLQIIPVETVVRNIVAGSMAKRLGREEGEPLPHSIVEYYYKSDPLDDPLIYPEHAVLFGWATEKELDTIHEMALKVNDILSRFLDELMQGATKKQIDRGLALPTAAQQKTTVPGIARAYQRRGLANARFRRRASVA